MKPAEAARLGLNFDLANFKPPITQMTESKGSWVDSMPPLTLALANFLLAETCTLLLKSVQSV